MIIIEEVVAKKQNELYNSLKNKFETLICDFNLSNKNKDSLCSFLKLMSYSEDEINNLLSHKQKGFLGFFK
jgi:SUMO ligase MMS21 Smc5/6 complex component